MICAADPAAFVGNPATIADEFRPHWVEFRAPGRKGPLASEIIGGHSVDHHPAVMSSQAFRRGGGPFPLLKGALGAAVALAALSLSTGSAQAACAPVTRPVPAG